MDWQIQCSLYQKYEKTFAKTDKLILKSERKASDLERWNNLKKKELCWKTYITQLQNL